MASLIVCSFVMSSSWFFSKNSRTVLLERPIAQAYPDNRGQLCGALEFWRCCNSPSMRYTSRWAPSGKAGGCSRSGRNR